MSSGKRCHARNRVVIILSPNKKEQPPMSKTILIQDHLRPALPTVLGCRDYQEQEQLLVRADRILRVSGVERRFVGLSLERYQAAAAGPVSQGDLVRQSERSEKALRCTVLKNILGEDYREMSVRLAQCELFRWFCKLPELEAVRVPGKSTLQEYANWLPHEEMGKVLAQLREAMADEDRAKDVARLNKDGKSGESDSSLMAGFRARGSRGMW